MISDSLKKFRGGNYQGPSDEKQSSEKPKDSGHSRSISLTDDEMQAFKSAQPGSDLACEVHGTLEGNGKFNVLSVSPLAGGTSYGDESDMANQVAQRVSPAVTASS